MAQGQEKHVILRWLLRIFQYDPWHCIGFTLIRIIGFTGLSIIPGLVIQRFFDHVSNRTLTDKNMAVFLAILVIVPIVQAASYYADIALSYGWVEKVRSILRRNIFQHIIIQPGELPVPQGQLMNNLRSDINTPIELVWDLPYFLAYATFSVCGILILGSIDWVITLVLLFPLILIILIVNWMKKRIECLFAEQQKAADGVNNALADLFSYAFTIKNNHAEEYFLQRFQRCNDERMKKVMQNDIFDTCLHSIYGNIINIGTGFILLLISRKIYNGSFTIGQFSLFVYFLNYVSNVTRLLGKTIAGLKRVAVSYERLKKVIPENTFHIVTDQRSSLQKKVEMVESTETVEQLERLDVKDLSYTYPNSTKGIRDITFSLERGSFTVISGKVGSGKSTLLKVLLGLLPADQGEIVWNEQHVRERNQFFVPPRAAYVPQEPHLFSETLHENIRLGSRVSAERVAEAIRLAVLEEDVEGLVHRLDTAIGTGGVNLSGGQRQRTAAARMFVRDAELWVLDDISSALDVQTEKELWRRVKEYVMEEQITCLVVTNKQYAMQYADQVICLDEVK